MCSLLRKLRELLQTLRSRTTRPPSECATNESPRSSSGDWIEHCVVMKVTTSSASRLPIRTIESSAWSEFAEDVRTITDLHKKLRCKLTAITEDMTELCLS